uniref:Uncharacterized protein n=1 Tax=Quercus lobata TaxID=97700 RepID=A0A7N2MZU5_QUELO
MSPTKHYASKISSKYPRMDSDNFKSIEVDMAYNDCYKRATIIMERVVRMETLEDTCIPDVFKERTWTKLLNLSGNVYSEIIKEFFSNAVDGDHINCWGNVNRWLARALKSFGMVELEARKLKYPNTGTESLLMGILVEARVRKEIHDETDRVTGKSKQISPVPIHLSIFSPNGSGI